MREISLTPIESKVFGTIVTNVHLPTRTDAEFADVREGFLQYGFLVLPRQVLSDAENIEFGKRFGELEFGAKPIANQEKHDDGSYGAIHDLETQRMRDNLGAEFWAHRFNLLANGQQMRNALKGDATGRGWPV